MAAGAGMNIVNEVSLITSVVIVALCSLAVAVSRHSLWTN